MFDYYWMLRARYRLPVLPIGLYLRGGLEGLGWELLRNPSGSAVWYTLSIPTSACRLWKQSNTPMATTGSARR
jgi:hypothetical protein